MRKMDILLESIFDGMSKGVLAAIIVAAVVVYLLMAVCCGAIAKGKGRTAPPWVLLGLLLPFISLIITACAENRNEPDDPLVRRPPVKKAAPKKNGSVPAKKTAPRNIPVEKIPRIEVKKEPQKQEEVKNFWTCPSCGSKNVEGEWTCKTCGTRVKIKEPKK